MTENIENNEVVETPVELSAGEMLRIARTTGRRKREIPTISKQLCIREEFLAALEAGDYSVIPEPVYILGFARNYAMELGLNPDEIVAKIKKEMGLVSDCAATDDEEVTACAMPSIKEEHWAKIWFVKAYQFVYQHWIWFLGGLLGLILVIVLISVFTPEQKAENAIDNNVAAVVETVAEPEYKMAVRERFGTNNREKADVILQAVQESWVKIEDGRGNTVFSRVLVPGDVYYVPAGDKYKATFGNAGGVDIWVEGKLAPDAGPDHTRKAGISMSPESLMSGKSK